MRKTKKLPTDQGYVFTTPKGKPIREDNFYDREWLPTLRRFNIRPRPFYNTRHSYISFLLSIGARPLFVSAQTGDSLKTLERHYAKYIPAADAGKEIVEESIQKSETSVKPSLKNVHSRGSGKSPKMKKPPKNQGLKNGAGDGDRTHDLMLGKHTL